VSDFCEERREEEVDVLRNLGFRVFKTQRGERFSLASEINSSSSIISSQIPITRKKTGHYGYKQHGNTDAM